MIILPKLIKATIVIVGLFLMIITLSLISIIFLIVAFYCIYKNRINAATFVCFVYLALVITIIIAGLSTSLLIPIVPSSSFYNNVGIDTYEYVVYTSNASVTSPENAESIVKQYLNSSLDGNYVKGFRVGQTKTEKNGIEIYEINDIECSSRKKNESGIILCSAREFSGTVLTTNTFGVSLDGKIYRFMHIVR